MRLRPLLGSAIASLALHAAVAWTLRARHPARGQSADAPVEVALHGATPRASGAKASSIRRPVAAVAGLERSDLERRSGSEREAGRSGGAAPGEGRSREAGDSPSRGTPEPRPDLFAASALGRAAGLELSAPSDQGYRPRRGVGGRDGRGGTDVASFLAEDAARARVRQGMVAPRLRDLERRLERHFDPPFAHVDVANKRELLHKQFMARLGRAPELKALPRGEDPARETTDDKLERIVAEPYFLGRRAEVFVRQRPDGTILEIALRLASGFRAFDDEAIAAVEKALAGRPPAEEDIHGGEVRTLWRLEATAYVVYSPTPQAQFDEATGKMEWVYPLEKRVDRSVQLMGIF